METDARPPMILWILTALLSLLAGVLGYLGYGEYLPTQQGFEQVSPTDQVYYTLQLFLLDPTPLGSPPYGHTLTAAMYLAPLATVLAVLQAVSLVFREQIAAWRLRHRRGHAVVVGSGAEAFVLARQLARTGRTVLVGSEVDPSAARRHGVRLVSGDPLDEATLVAAGVAGAARVYALADTSATNAGVALLVRALHRADVAVHAWVDDGKLVAALRARRLSTTGDRDYRLDFFSLEDIAAAALLDAHDRDGQPPVIVGTSAFGAAVGREVRRRRRHAGAPELLTALPDGSVVDAPVDGTVYVCSDDPDLVLNTGLSLLLAGHSRVVLCLGTRSLLGRALEQQLFGEIGGRLTVFGILDAACDPAVLDRNTQVERLARALHARYLAEYATPGSTRASEQPWERLDERYQADNRAHAEDIGTKLAAIGAAIVPASPDLPLFTLPPSEVEPLAAMEHDRWMASRRADIERSGEPHPDMKAWDDPALSEGAKEKDRMFVRSLPTLLAAEDLAIIRLPGAQA